MTFVKMPPCTDTELSVKELAHRWRRSPKTIYNRLSSKQPMPTLHERLGRLFFLLTEVEEFEKRHFR